MSTPTRTPLSLLAEFGPLSRDTIARALDVPWVCVVEHIGDLKRQGLATEASATRWDVTDAGRALAQRLAVLEAEVQRIPAPDPADKYRCFPTRRRAC